MGAQKARGRRSQWARELQRPSAEIAVRVPQAQLQRQAAPQAARGASQPLLLVTAPAPQLCRIQHSPLSALSALLGCWCWEPVQQSMAPAAAEHPAPQWVARPNWYRLQYACLTDWQLAVQCVVVAQRLAWVLVPRSPHHRPLPAYLSWQRPPPGHFLTFLVFID